MASSSALFHSLIGLAWLFVVASLITTLALPVPPPDITNCQTSYIGNTPLNCCLPVSNTIIDFTPPSYSAIRVRPAAHLANSTYLAKYRNAVQKMKALGPDHPWNHMQQAKVHCAYCNGAYNMTGYNVTLQVHGSWLFFPFHRLYLYFYERILGKLINDSSFAIPFWNWDAPEGMTLPSMYTDSSCSLYDKLRDGKHQPPTIADLNFNGTDASYSTNFTLTNLRTMYRQMIRNSATAKLFMGYPYRAGNRSFPGSGQLELTPHNTMHVWTGDRNQDYGENMGTFYSAGRDPIFYAHHANVDRMWEIWKTIGGKNRKNFNDPDWLDSAFIFWDENLNLVRVKVRDCLDTKKLGYVYQDVSIPWSKCQTITQSVQKPMPRNGVTFPVRLSSALTVQVNRPKVLRSREEKENEEEVLILDEINLDETAFVKFDVYINAGADDVSITPDSTQFAGSFVNVPMGMEDSIVTGRRSQGVIITTQMMLGLTDILDELNADGDRSILVTLVPKADGDRTTVGNISIGFST